MLKRGLSVHSLLPLRIFQDLLVGLRSGRGRVPPGTKERITSCLIRAEPGNLIAPGGAWNVFGRRFPTDKSVGYFRQSLSRDDRSSLLLAKK